MGASPVRRAGRAAWALAALLVLAPPAAADPPAEMPLSVLSYNVAGIPLVHAQIDRRIPAIAREIARLELDVACLQEVWRDSDADLLIAAGKEAGLAHSARFRAEGSGSGLLILSRYPITSKAFRPFPENGDRGRILSGHLDKLAQKGVGLAHIETPIGPVAVIDTHLVAPYRVDGRDTFVGQRFAQIGQVLEVLRTVPKEVPAILCGDLNAREGSPEMQRLVLGTGVKDTKADGSWRGIDYVLARDAPARAVETKESSRVLDRKVEDGRGPALRLSDHPAILARVVIRRVPATR